MSRNDGRRAVRPAAPTSLGDLEPGSTGVVAAIDADYPDRQRRRLMELGFYPGTRVRAVLRSPMGDPVAYELRGMTVALRREQARAVRLQRVADGEEA